MAVFNCVKGFYVIVKLTHSGKLYSFDFSKA